MTLSVILVGIAVIGAMVITGLVMLDREVLTDEEAARRYQERIIRREK